MKAQFQGKERYLTHAQSGNVRGSADFDQFGGGFYKDGRKAAGIRV